MHTIITHLCVRTYVAVVAAAVVVVAAAAVVVVVAVVVIIFFFLPCSVFFPASVSEE